SSLGPRGSLRPVAFRLRHQRRSPRASRRFAAQVRGAVLREPPRSGAGGRTSAGRPPSSRYRPRHRRAGRSRPAPRARPEHAQRGPPALPRRGGPAGCPSRRGLSMPPRYEVIGIEGLPEIHMGEDLGRLIAEAATAQGTPLAAGSLPAVSQKIVSKTEGRVLRLGDITPSAESQAVAEEIGRDPRLVEVILRESRRVVRKEKGVLIVETHHGLVCANAGVDQSNVDADTACLLPEDSDRSARGLRDGLATLTGHRLGIIIADTFGRPWREGLTNVAIGVAGLEPLKSYLGEEDTAGPGLQASI